MKLPALICLASLAAWLTRPGVAADAPNGQELSKQVCATCHLYPEPSLLNRRVWNDFVLPKMKIYLGLSPEQIDTNEEAALLRASGVFPEVPLVTANQFNAIAKYYLQNAPAEMEQGIRPEIRKALTQFEAVRPRSRRSPPLTTMVAINERSNVVYTADAQVQNLDIWNPQGELAATVPVGNIAVDLKDRGTNLYLTAIGQFFPSEKRIGQVLRLAWTPQGPRREVLMENLPRAVDLELADLNGDGKTDLALCLFGYITGSFGWYEEISTGKFSEHLLFPKAGAVRSQARDFNRDGKIDLAVLVGQATESLFIYENQGKGVFKQRTVFQKPSSYGHTYFEVADFNKDGLDDFLVTNGDNGDYASPPKGYHGIRIYLGQKDGTYRESYFFPMHGAFKAMARDFDGDGDLDIAAISFFPDYDKSPEESFVYLENKGGLDFSASTFPQCLAGRWLTMDAGDLDGDGDLDIVLGSMTGMPEGAPPKLKEMWERSSPSFVILRNLARKPPAGSARIP